MARKPKRDKQWREDSWDDVSESVKDVARWGCCWWPWGLLPLGILSGVLGGQPMLIVASLLPIVATVLGGWWLLARDGQTRSTLENHAS